jgi:dephospho-CoA kinase
MIVGLVGSICSGKQELALYIAELYGFEVVNLMALFKKRYSHMFNKNNLPSPVKIRKEESSEESGEESKESEDEPSFCFEYYMGNLTINVYYLHSCI